MPESELKPSRLSERLIDRVPNERFLFLTNDLLCLFPGDNNGWPHLFDKYFGMPSYTTGTRSSICCKCPYLLLLFRVVCML